MIDNPFTDYTGLGLNLLRVPVDFTVAAWQAVGTHEVFTVTGAVRMRPFAIIRGQPTSGGAATIEGRVDDGTVLVAATAIGGMAAGLFWGSALLDDENALSSILWGDRGSLDRDYGINVAVAALTGGSIDFFALWTPLEAGALVVAGSGGAL